MTTPHYPKGSMCRACRHAHRQCDHLDFAAMPVIERNSLIHGTPTNTVKCTEFERDQQQ